MLIYLDANCFNRPFDDQSQDRVCRETQAVLEVLQRVLEGEDDLVWSSALAVELTAHPDPQIRTQLVAWATRGRKNITSAAVVRSRVEELVRQGLHPLDAAHVARRLRGGGSVRCPADVRRPSDPPKSARRGYPPRYRSSRIHAEGRRPWHKC